MIDWWTNLEGKIMGVQRLAALLLPFFVCLHAEADDCTKTLIQDSSSVQSNSAARYAMSNIADSSLSQSEKASLGVTVPIEGVPVTLSGSDDKAYTSKFFQQTGINWSHEQAVSMLAQTLSETAAKIYRDCVQNNRHSGPFMIAHDATRTEVSVKLTWYSPTGAGTTTNDIRLSASGVDLSDLRSQWNAYPSVWKNADSRILQLKRLPRADARLDLEVGGDTDHLFIAYVPTVTVAKNRVPLRYPEASEIKLDTDSAGHNVGPLSNCFDVGNKTIESGSVVIGGYQTGGPIDGTSWARIDSATDHRFCYTAFLRPLTSGHGGIMTYHVNYTVADYTFSVN